ncbi:hypothetical protein [Streptomyces griseofuscus]|uniref:DnaT DNA-binding domain-containing protein n=1 Tax=Streptomyces griseofuscus TaxID=146922 RepID=A0A3R8Q684_9ACTN|nr:hypothetical protein [Streptomyces griseofuscus]RRQ81518.1 hypothetical protein CQW44_30420 [Streptomyces griseofuscus]
MARGHGRILTSIWEDTDFLKLDEKEQRFYLFLISQPNLNHAGLLPLTLRRWSRKAKDLTSAEVEKRLQSLDDAEFIVVDDDTEELLIRSFVRNDGVWRMPKVMGAMVSGALEISSRRLQLALLAEMDRIPLDDLSNEPTKTSRGAGPSIRAQVSEHITTLRKAFGNPTPDPSRGGSEAPSAPPSGTPSDTPSERDTEGPPKPSTRGRAGAHVRAAPSPAPAPSPSPTPDPFPVGGEESGETSGSSEPRAERPDGLHSIPDDFAISDAERRWANATYPGLDLNFETDQFIRYWRSEGRRKRNWHDAWQKWIADSAKRANERGGRPSLRSVGNTGSRAETHTADDYTNSTVEDLFAS